MDFEYKPEHEEFRRELRGWLEDNLPDGWIEDGQKMPDGKERIQFLRDWQRQLYDGNWAGVHWPEVYGGRGVSDIEQMIYREEMARARTPRLLNFVGIELVGPTLIEEGSEYQKDRFLSNILSGEEIWCQGYSEPDAGSDIASLTTRARKEGGEWIINGQKIWTSFAHLADWCFLVARTDMSGSKHEGITTLLVDMNQDAITTEPIHQASDRKEFNQVYFDDAVAAEENVIGEVHNGWDVVMTLSAFEHGMTKIFSIEQDYYDILEYCRSETRNGEALLADPTVRRQLADIDARVQAAKLSHYRNVSKRKNTGVPGPEGSMELVIADEIRNDLTDFAMNVRGPDTSLWEDSSDNGQCVEDYLESYGLWIAAGTGDIQRNIIGERVLGLPKDDKSRTSHRD